MTSVVETLAWIGNRIGKPPGWERLVRIFASPEKFRLAPEICLVREGLLFRAQPSIPLAWHVALFGTYEPQLREIIKVVVPGGGVAIDVGANIGWHTLLMARLAGHGGRVLAVEANPSVCERLRENLELNRFTNVLVVNCAAANEDGYLSFQGPDASEPSSGDGHVLDSGAASPGGSTIRVPARKLDAMAADAGLERVDLIKIDVEGFEWPVLQGAEAVISRFRPHVVFEFNAEYTGRGGGTSALFEAFFARHRYKLFVMERNWASEVKSGSWPGCVDIWAVPGPSPIRSAR
jgi:FkbM family methyltransferase